MTIGEILGALGVVVMCIIFGAMGLMEAYKPYEEENNDG